MRSGLGEAAREGMTKICTREVTVAGLQAMRQLLLTTTISVGGFQRKTKTTLSKAASASMRAPLDDCHAPGAGRVRQLLHRVRPSPRIPWPVHGATHSCKGRLRAASSASDM